LTDTVEKGILRGPLSNIDSRRASNEQDRFKKSFPQLHFLGRTCSDWTHKRH
jgi:hypothetical protein